MTLFPLRNGHHNITLVCEIISVWKGRSRVIPSKGEYFSHFSNENIFTFELFQMFGAATNTNKFCIIATGGPALASGEHVTDGLVAARSRAAARGLLAALGWVGGPRGRLYKLFTHCFFNPAPGLVAARGISNVYTCA